MRRLWAEAAVAAVRLLAGAEARAGGQASLVAGRAMVVPGSAWLGAGGAGEGRPNPTLTFPSRLDTL